jgi:hypothetical protein
MKNRVGMLEVVRDMARMDDIRYLNLFGRFCDADRCTFQRGNQLLFLEKSHLSSTGAEFAVDGYFAS